MRLNEARKSPNKAKMCQMTGIELINENNEPNNEGNNTLIEIIWDRSRAKNGWTTLSERRKALRSDINSRLSRRKLRGRGPSVKWIEREKRTDAAATRRDAASDATMATNQKPRNLATISQPITEWHDESRRPEAGIKRRQTDIYRRNMRLVGLLSLKTDLIRWMDR